MPTDWPSRMPLDRLEISSFKSIVNQTMDFGRVNVFIGANGSGKTNLLEAIGVLSCALSGEVSYAALAKRGVRLSTPQVFKSSFRDIPRHIAFVLDAAMDSVHYKVSISPKDENQFHFRTETLMCPEGKVSRGTRGQCLRFGVPAEPHDFLGAGEGLVPKATYFNRFNHQPIDELIDYAIYAPSTPVLRGIAQDSSFKEPLGLYGGSLAVALKETIRDSRQRGQLELQRLFQLLNWFHSIGTTERVSSQLQSSHVHTGNLVVKYTDRFMRDSFNALYAYDVSEGSLYILFVLLLLLHKKAPNVFALDNVDNALHPDLVWELMRHITQMPAINSGDKQLFLTTHNPTTLDAIDLFDSNQRLFTVARNKHGHTEVRRVEPPKDFTREKWGEKYGEMRLSEIWRAGLIGGNSAGW